MRKIKKEVRDLIRKHLKTTVVVDENKVTLDLFNELRIGDDVDYEIDYAALRFGFVSSIAEDYREELEIAKNELKIYEAEQDEMIREDLVKVTEMKVKNAIIRTPEWIKRKKQIISLEKSVNKLENAKEAYKIKSGLLQSKSANRRSGI